MSRSLSLGIALLGGTMIYGSAHAASFGGMSGLVAAQTAPVDVAAADTAAAPVILVGTTRIDCPTHKVTIERPPRK